MRLIDADRLNNTIERNFCYPGALTPVVDAQPTVGNGDITPELAVSAYNVLRKYAAGKKNCKECIFYPKCGKSFTFCPEEWPEIKNP